MVALPGPLIFVGPCCRCFDAEFAGSEPFNGINEQRARMDRVKDVNTALSARPHCLRLGYGSERDQIVSDGNSAWRVFVLPFGPVAVARLDGVLPSFIPLYLLHPLAQAVRTTRRRHDESDKTLVGHPCR